MLDPDSSAPVVDRPARLLFLGACGGFLSGLLGVGGGIVLIPLLSAARRDLSQHELHGTSLAVMVFTATAAFITYVLHGKVSWALGLPLALGGVIGAPLGSMIAGRLHPERLKVAFALFLAVVGVRMLVPLGAATVSVAAHAFALMVAIGATIGLLSGFLGVGGGVLLVPLLTLLLHVPQHLAQSASLIMVVPTAVAGLRGYRARGQVRWSMVPCLAAGSVATAILGSLASARLPGARLQQVFGVLVIGLAAHIIVRRVRAHERKC